MCLLNDLENNIGLTGRLKALCFWKFPFNTFDTHPDIRNDIETTHSRQTGGGFIENERMEKIF